MNFEAHDLDLKILLGMLIQRAKNGTWTSNELSTIAAIADKCYNNYGTAVKLARAMKGLELDLLQGCNQSIKGSSKNEKYESEMAISDKFESIDVIFFEAKQIQVYNMNGVLIYNALISKDQTTLNINTQKWNGGIYIIKTIDNNDKIQSKKYLKM